MKKIVGIIPSALGFDSDNPFDDKYYVQNSYIDRIKKVGGIPIIIPPVNLQANNDALRLCDAFLLIGGKKVYTYHFDVIEYALKYNKKLLGICLGMQAIGMYANNDLEEKCLEKVDNHYFDNVIREKHEMLIHNVVFDKNSELGKLLGKDICVNSIHNFALNYVNKPFKTVGFSNDKVIEAIEYNDIIGVQFHPELMKETDSLFEWLVLEK